MLKFGKRKFVENLANTAEAIHFLDEAYKHCKAIGFDKNSELLIEETHLSKKLKLENGNVGVSVDGNTHEFLDYVGEHRFWGRESLRKIPS